MLPLCAPILAQAAILRFFSSKSASQAFNLIGRPFNGIRGTVTMANMGSARMDYEDTEDDETEDDDTESKDVIRDSRQHDRDFQRMTCCYDASICRGMKRTAWRGSWEGSWEGNFSFFEFDAFREMLAGSPRALYQGSFGEQAQVWKIKETFVRPSRTNKGKTPLKGLPLRGPMTNAGFPTGQRMSATAGLSSATAEEATTQETITQQVEALEGYEIIPDEKVDEAMADDGGEESGMEILLTGTGHSAWGKFILKGRVRAWDGMASLVKEYAVSQAVFHREAHAEHLTARLSRKVDLPRIYSLRRCVCRAMEGYIHPRGVRRLRRHIHPEPSAVLIATAAIRSTTLFVRSLTSASNSVLMTAHASTPRTSISSNRSTCNRVSICASVILPLVGRAAITRLGRSDSSGAERSRRGWVK